MIDTIISQVISDPTASSWLRVSLQTALARDPMDAATDAEHLAALLSRRNDAILQEALRGRAPLPQLQPAVM